MVMFTFLEGKARQGEAPRRSQGGEGLSSGLPFIVSYGLSYGHHEMVGDFFLIINGWCLYVLMNQSSLTINVDHHYLTFLLTMLLVDNKAVVHGDVHLAEYETPSKPPY